MPDATTVRRIIDLRTRKRLSLRQIGALVGLSGERVRRLLKGEGIVFTRVARLPKKRKKQTTLSLSTIQALYGCSLEELGRIQGDLLLSDQTSPAFLYRKQRSRWMHINGWDFTLPTWWALWEPHWPRRLTGGLVMVAPDRTHPIGPFNAEIRTRSEVMQRFQDRRKR